MTEKRQFQFSDDRSTALIAMDSIASGKGWINVVPVVDDDIPDLKVNIFGLWVNRGAPVASYVTQPPRDGVAQPSSLGLLHSGGRLGPATLSTILCGETFVVRQNHSQRGLLLDVPFGTPVNRVLNVMCTMTLSLCDFVNEGRWRLDLFTR